MLCPVSVLFIVLDETAGATLCHQSPSPAVVSQEAFKAITPFLVPKKELKAQAMIFHDVSEGTLPSHLKSGESSLGPGRSGDTSTADRSAVYLSPVSAGPNPSWSRATGSASPLPTPSHGQRSGALPAGRPNSTECEPAKGLWYLYACQELRGESYDRNVFTFTVAFVFKVVPEGSGSELLMGLDGCDGPSITGLHPTELTGNNSFGERTPYYWGDGSGTFSAADATAVGGYATSAYQTVRTGSRGGKGPVLTRAAVVESINRYVTALMTSSAELVRLEAQFGYLSNSLGVEGTSTCASSRGTSGTPAIGASASTVGVMSRAETSSSIGDVVSLPTGQGTSGMMGSSGNLASTPAVAAHTSQGGTAGGPGGATAGRAIVNAFDSEESWTPLGHVVLQLYECLVGQRDCIVLANHYTLSVRPLRPPKPRFPLRPDHIPVPIRPLPPNRGSVVDLVLIDLFASMDGITPIEELASSEIPLELALEACYHLVTAGYVTVIDPVEPDDLFQVTPAAYSTIITQDRGREREALVEYCSLFEGRGLRSHKGSAATSVAPSRRSTGQAATTTEDRRRQPASKRQGRSSSPPAVAERQSVIANRVVVRSHGGPGHSSNLSSGRSMEMDEDERVSVGAETLEPSPGLEESPPPSIIASSGSRRLLDIPLGTGGLLNPAGSPESGSSKERKKAVVASPKTRTLPKETLQAAAVAALSQFNFRSLLNVQRRMRTCYPQYSDAFGHWDADSMVALVRFGLAKGWLVPALA